MDPGIFIERVPNTMCRDRLKVVVGDARIGTGGTQRGGLGTAQVQSLGK